MPEYGKRLMKFMNENRYISRKGLEKISPMAIGCGEVALAKYILGALSMGLLEQKNDKSGLVWLHIPNLKKLENEVFPWEK